MFTHAQRFGVFFVKYLTGGNFAKYLAFPDHASASRCSVIHVQIFITKSVNVCVFFFFFTEFVNSSVLMVFFFFVLFSDN